MKLKELRADVMKGVDMIEFNSHQFQQSPSSGGVGGGCLIGACLAAQGRAIGEDSGLSLRQWFLKHYEIPTPTGYVGEELRFERDLINMEYQEHPRDPRLIILDKYFPEPSEV